jgi:shikimate kinase
MAPVVVLIGAPGAGKSTIGRIVADRLDVPFRDTDADVESRAGKSIPEIFVLDGEPAFRALEHEAVATALREHNGVLALGGGAVLDPQTQALLATESVVWLKVASATAAGRVGVSGPRPVIVGSPHSTLVKLLAERTPIYEALAKATIETDFREPEVIADDVIAAVSKEATS